MENIFLPEISVSKKLRDWISGFTGRGEGVDFDLELIKKNIMKIQNFGHLVQPVQLSFCLSLRTKVANFDMQYRTKGAFHGHKF
jgi:hypothetical protein